MRALSFDTPLAEVGAQIIFSGLPVQRCGQRKLGRVAPTPPTDARPATMAA
jgi:hypothetical protein